MLGLPFHTPGWRETMWYIIYYLIKETTLRQRTGLKQLTSTLSRHLVQNSAASLLTSLEPATRPIAIISLPLLTGLALPHPSYEVTPLEV